jgi:poly(3-hydroxybutyrate) depolymerase
MRTTHLLALLPALLLTTIAIGQDEVGSVVRKQVAHGVFFQFMPRSVNRSSKVLVICHGSFPSSGSAESAASTCLIAWKRFAQSERVIVVAPAFDNKNYAASSAGALGGYRSLVGRQVGANEFLHEIIAVYEKLNPQFDGRFFLFGDGAGGQFANRYIVRHPERVIGALISSPAWFAFPDPDERWPTGTQPRKGNFKWGDTEERVLIDEQPDPETWLQASQKPIMVIVGQLDTKEVKAGTGKTHVSQATKWVEEMNGLAKENGKRGSVELFIVPRTEHNYGQLARAGMPFLKKVLRRR